MVHWITTKALPHLIYGVGGQLSSEVGTHLLGYHTYLSKLWKRFKVFLDYILLKLLYFISFELQSLQQHYQSISFLQFFNNIKYDNSSAESSMTSLFINYQLICQWMAWTYLCWVLKYSGYLFIDMVDIWLNVETIKLITWTIMLSFTVMYYLYLALNFGQTVITIHCNDLESLFHNSRVLPFCFIDILSIYSM